jgi:hypothetical protein
MGGSFSPADAMFVVQEEVELWDVASVKDEAAADEHERCAERLVESFTFLRKILYLTHCQAYKLTDTKSVSAGLACHISVNA